MIEINANNIADSMSALKLQLESILDLFDAKSRIFYIDYPVHTNIGDLLINVATEQFFLDNKVSVHQRYSTLNAFALSHLKADENTTFLCHGGGNFGDLYPDHQNVREWLIEKFPRSRIIFLPQSLYYSSEYEQRKSLEKIAAHPNCHILVRDRESLDTLRRFHINKCSMMPDMAHWLWGYLKPTSQSEHGNDIYFLRQDKEAMPVPAELMKKFEEGSVDWKNIISGPHRVLGMATYFFLKTEKGTFSPGLSASMWYSVRDIMINDAVTYFSKHDHIYTNRLHAMLLALLLKHDVTAFDNSYGKVSRYLNAWFPANVKLDTFN